VAWSASARAAGAPGVGGDACEARQGRRQRRIERHRDRRRWAGGEALVEEGHEGRGGGAVESSGPRADQPVGKIARRGGGAAAGRSATGGGGHRQDEAVEHRLDPGLAGGPRRGPHRRRIGGDLAQRGGARAQRRAGRDPQGGGHAGPLPRRREPRAGPPWYMTAMSAVPDDHGADRALAAACLAGEPAALRRFDAEVLGPAVDSVRGIDPTPAFVDEIRQRVRAHLLVGEGRPRLADYAGRGPLAGWVAVAAVRSALMLRRSTARRREVGDDDWAGALALVATGNPELELQKREHAAAFTAALREAAAALEPRLRAVLAMHFTEDLSIDQIGAVYAVHRATAARWVQRARDELIAATRAILIARLGLTPSEIARVGALVQSQVDVSLSQLFAA
jgi:RNA polymerase sigma-70 factor (ECF subfamily)